MLMVDRIIRTLADQVGSLRVTILDAILPLFRISVTLKHAGSAID